MYNYWYNNKMYTVDHLREINETHKSACKLYDFFSKCFDRTTDLYWFFSFLLISMFQRNKNELSTPFDDNVNENNVIIGAMHYCTCS